jgi:DNA invertase Pin-like site-specific DNA recombinase
MRRARLEGRVIGRPALVLDSDAILADRRRGLSISHIARADRIGRTTVHRILQQDAAALKEKVVA